MRNDIRLFINGKEIEFSQDPKILLNYKETELHNPTVVRNSFTKTIQIEGTNRNNDVFGHIWNLERIQEGMSFSPIKKADFQLFVNDELFQKGYCKLDKVTRTNNTTQYSLTLYGGLGSFFYNLTYDQDNEGNNKKTLASLKYALEGEIEPELEYEINKDNVYEAWGQLAGFGNSTNPRWNVINFVPALNGIPGDFDATKVLINNYQLNQGGGSGFQNGITVEGTTYRPVLNGLMDQNGYSLGEMPEDLHEWQTRDLRSWCQRPCVSMYRIIQACCNPDNNGGYQVKLDSHFFHQNNPYYFDSWVTMPLLKDLEGVGGGETYDITGATISTGGTYRSVSFNTPSLASLNNVNMNVTVKFTPDASTTATNLYAYRKLTTTGGSGRSHVKTFENNCGVVMQMFAYGRSGEVVGQSKAYFLGSNKFFPYYGDAMWDGFYDPEHNTEIGVEPEYEYVEGYWHKSGSSYTFVDNQGHPAGVNFSFSAPNDFTTLVLKVKQPDGDYTDFYGVWSENSSKKPDVSFATMYTSKYKSVSGNYTEGQAMMLDRVLGSWSLVVTSMEGVGTDYEGLFSGTKITKERLLTTQHTPADYLLSYCKMFGLYFYYDSTEDADDTERYPSGVIHIMDRDTFYTDEVVDLAKMIDWNKNVEITPAMANTKWYKFDLEHVEGELDTGYKAQFGQEYGSQVINTNYNFDSETTNLYDGNVFKSAIMSLEKDKYYKKSPVGLPVYQYNGLTYTLFSRTTTGEEFDTYEIEYPVKTTMYMQSVNPDYEFYDAFPKLNLHGENNEAVDGENVLVFFKGSVQAPADYWLTDDVTDMVILNDGAPCWILTKSEYNADGEQIARKLNYFPMFTRDLILFGQNYGNIVHSWNFGHPQQVYSPDTYTTEGDSIYDVAWKNYIRDLYDVNTRKLTCYVRAEMDNRPWPWWLRRFYWFENSIWRLNEIKDLNVGSFDTTKMEFIKVQDMNNYKLDRIDYQGHNELVITDTAVGCSSGTVHGYMFEQSAGGWFGTDYIVGVDGNGNNYYLETAQVMSPYTGRGQFVTYFTINIPANSGDTPITWTVAVEDDFDNRYRATFVQDTCEVSSTLTIQPTSGVVFSPSGQTAFTITYNRVSAITVSSSESWATAVLNGNTVTVTYTKNNTIAARYTNIVVRGTGVDGEITATARLAQDGLGMITAPQLVELDYFDDASATFQVTTNDDWTSTITDNE